MFASVQFLLYLVLLAFQRIYLEKFEDNWTDPDPFDHTNTIIHGCSENRDCRNEKYCAGVPNCLAGAECVDKYCECPKGRFGWRCQYATCSDYTLCKNGGECMIVNNTHLCACPPSTDGDKCESKTCSTEFNCNGVCTTKETCDCGFLASRVPPDSQTKQFECVPNCDTSNPCKNGGKCSINDDNETYVCECLEGHHGHRCQLEDCEESWCTNGECFEKECHCYPGYDGDRCQHASCDNYDGCFNKGTCSHENNIIKCQCSSQKYSGTYCEVECAKECSETSVCGLDGKCYCNLGFYGEECNFTIPEVISASYTTSLMIIIILCICIIAVYWYFFGRKDTSHFSFSMESKSLDKLDMLIG